MTAQRKLQIGDRVYLEDDSSIKGEVVDESGQLLIAYMVRNRRWTIPADSPGAERFTLSETEAAA